MSAELYYEDIEIGDELDSIERVVTPEHVQNFLAIRGRMSGRPSRFTDDAHAKSEGLPHAIVPGAMNTALVAQLLTGWSPTVTVKKLDVSFRQVVPHNTPLELKGIVTNKHVVHDEPQVECDVFLENEDGSMHVIGHAVVALPMRGA